ncbi:PAS domain-containing protein [Chitinibacter bivalviorum]|uniref:PAS domain-containing protein n=1 Tax=Chitinibacter bivalviorum TaxID=2739434 RepID=A0A7H9BM86_9NEIS|nr:PAS domain-containing protein [Chitinibacter bivalviorum]QLG89358.1 PAS domain-containing protein [Chitinibacter bivalviorum]
MKNRIIPTQHEKLMRENDFIVSKTDLKGRITYGNRIFIEFSGYSERELLGAQHNIIRHPDMPRGVFKLLWDTIASGQEIFAYVKNMAKDGSYYWVFANVTPDYDANGNIIGYLSVRRYPKRSAVDTCTGLYQQMLAEEQRVGARDACEASIALLQSVLKQHGVSYEELVLSL